MLDIPADFNDLTVIFGRVVGYALGFAGVVLFILLITAGFKFISSGNDPKALDAAKKTLTSAIVGFIVILLAFLILVLIKVLTGVDVTNFNAVAP